jgi:hypothetical protein
MVELATPASVLECGKQPRLVLDQRMINVNLRQVIHAQRFSEDTV